VNVSGDTLDDLKEAKALFAEQAVITKTRFDMRIAIGVVEKSRQ
jgi:hypothetical protein